MKEKIYKIVASAFGVGFIPKGSGTFGAILACVGVVGVHESVGDNAFLYNTILLTLSIVGLWIGQKSAAYTEQLWGEDASKIVIDEVVGQWISLCFIPFSWRNLLLGLLWFRLYDIFKPFYIRRFEQYPNGWGVMLDDVAAGLWANVSLQILILIL